MILDGHRPESIAAAAETLAAGRLIGLPTETVYGLAGDAGQDRAVRAIFDLKGRPSDHPLIVHVRDAQAALAWAETPPPFAARLMQACWPGPLTLILSRRAGVGAAAAGGQASIGLRCPSHPVARAVLDACAVRGVDGVAAPSANRFGRVSPTTAAHVRAEFGDELLVLDGGPCEVGVESTIVDCTRGRPVLLRPGRIDRTRIESVSGLSLMGRDQVEGPTPKASGTLEAHYAPQARLRLMDGAALQTALDLLGPRASGLAVWSRQALRSPSARVHLRRMPEDAQAVEQQLFSVLRGFDDLGVALIWVEMPPGDGAWEAVRDRLGRAAAA